VYLVVLPVARRVLRQERFDQDGDVLGPLSQRWQRYRRNRQPVEEVLSEGATPHRLPKVAIGCRDDPNVDRDRNRPADWADLTPFENPQQTRLQINVELADLVEKDRSTVSGDKLPWLRLSRPGE
jgi:hypothetical protein